MGEKRLTAAPTGLTVKEGVPNVSGKRPAWRDGKALLAKLDRRKIQKIGKGLAHSNGACSRALDPNRSLD